MDQESLVTESIDAGARFLRDFASFAPIRSAVWLREDDDGRWYLHIVSDGIDFHNYGVAYGEVLNAVKRMDNPKIDPFRVRIVPISDPIASRIQQILQRQITTTPP